ncbi:MAG: hypothetical protein ACE5EK_06460 [Nitrospinales bacterium]
MKIPPSDVQYSSLSLVDVGGVFWWRGRLFRGVPGDHAPLVRRMFDSGLVAKLVERGLFVHSEITPYRLDGYELIVEHDVIKVPVYPREWTFSMLKDAALLVLELNKVALEFGFQTKDCHGYNILFRNSRPVFVDLGSFVPVTYRGDVLLAYREFLQCYYYPLQIWRAVGGYLGARLACNPFAKLPSEVYLRTRWPIFRYIKEPSLVRAIKTLHKIETLPHRDIETYNQDSPDWAIPLISLLQKMKIAHRRSRITRLKKKIERTTDRFTKTKWSKYHDAFENKESVSSTPRFDYVVDKLNSLHVGSIMEVAGNQGVLSRLLKERMPAVDVICTDGDEVALDKGYRAARRDAVDINWAVLNPFAAESGVLEIPMDRRFKADAAVALALTHHLILKQGYRIDFVLETIGRYAEKYILIEFMPQGLTDGIVFPEFPDWYNVAWFRDAFLKKFELIEERQLESNRILFVGKKFRPADSSLSSQHSARPVALQGTPASGA